MSGERIAKSTQEQAVAAWIDFRNVLRLHELAEKLANQDINFEAAMAELQKLKIFVSDPAHILGSIKQKHGEIAEHVQVAFMNAEQRVVGQAASHTFDGVGRLAPEDYLRFGKMVQSKFYMGVSGTLTAIADHLDTYPRFLDEGGSYDIAKNHYNELMRIYQGGATGAALTDSDRKLYEAIKDWETLHNVRFDNVVHPSVVNYDDVQLETVHNTIQAEEAKIEETDQQRAMAQLNLSLKDARTASQRRSRMPPRSLRRTASWRSAICLRTIYLTFLRSGARSIIPASTGGTSYIPRSTISTALSAPPPQRQRSFSLKNKGDIVFINQKSYPRVGFFAYSLSLK